MDYQNANNVHALGQDISIIKCLEVSDSRHCSNDTKEADILDRCELSVNGVKLGSV